MDYTNTDIKIMPGHVIKHCCDVYEIVEKTIISDIECILCFHIAVNETIHIPLNNLELLYLDIIDFNLRTDSIAEEQINMFINV